MELLKIIIDFASQDIQNCLVVVGMFGMFGMFAPNLPKQAPAPRRTSTKAKPVRRKAKRAKNAKAKKQKAKTEKSEWFKAPPMSDFQDRLWTEYRMKKDFVV